MMNSSAFVGLTSAGATSTETPPIRYRGRFFEPRVRPWLLWLSFVACLGAYGYIGRDLGCALWQTTEPVEEDTAPVAMSAIKDIVPIPPPPVVELIPVPAPVPVLPPAPKLKAGQEIYQDCIGRWRDVIATGYSPHDPIDGNYHATKGEWRWITADGTTNVLEEPYGIAVPHKKGKPSWVKYGTKLIIPSESGYLRNRSNRMFVADDTGSTISHKTRETGTVHVDLRFKSTESAMRYGTKKIRVFIVDEELEGE